MSTPTTTFDVVADVTAFTPVPSGTKTRFPISLIPCTELNA